MSPGRRRGVAGCVAGDVADSFQYTSPGCKRVGADRAGYVADQFSAANQSVYQKFIAVNPGVSVVNETSKSGIYNTLKSTSLT